MKPLMGVLAIINAAVTGCLSWYAVGQPELFAPVLGQGVVAIVLALVFTGMREN